MKNTLKKLLTIAISGILIIALLTPLTAFAATSEEPGEGEVVVTVKAYADRECTFQYPTSVEKAYKLTGLDIGQVILTKVLLFEGESLEIENTHRTLALQKATTTPKPVTTTGTTPPPTSSSTTKSSLNYTIALKDAPAEITGSGAWSAILTIASADLKQAVPGVYTDTITWKVTSDYDDKVVNEGETKITITISPANVAGTGDEADVKKYIVLGLGCVIIIFCLVKFFTNKKKSQNKGDDDKKTDDKNTVMKN